MEISFWEKSNSKRICRVLILAYLFTGDYDEDEDEKDKRDSRQGHCFFIKDIELLTKLWGMRWMWAEIQ